MTVISTADLTTKAIDGTGVFDELMETTQIRLQAEYSNNRIRGTEYSQVYLGAMQAVMQQSVAFLLGKQQADAQAELTKQQTLNLVSEEENIAKQGLLLTEQVLKLQQEIQYGKKQELLIDAQILKIRQENLVLANEVAKGVHEILIAEQQVNKVTAEAALVTEQVNLTTQNTLKAEQEVLNLKQEVLKAVQEVLVMKEQVKKSYAEALLINKQVSKLEIDTNNAVSEGTTIVRNQEKLKAERELLEQKFYSELSQIADSFSYRDPISQLTTGDFYVAGLLGRQMDKINAEGTLLGHKANTELASITDVINNTAVAGVIGKQKTLYQAQSDGFARDAEYKLAKLYSESWSVRRSTDEATGANAAALGDTQAAAVMTKAGAGIGVTITPSANI